VGRDLRKLSFLFRGEMYFHLFKIRESLASGKLHDGPVAKPSPADLMCIK
jgi:hypothetical protein